MAIKSKQFGKVGSLGDDTFLDKLETEQKNKKTDGEKDVLERMAKRIEKNKKRLAKQSKGSMKGQAPNRKKMVLKRKKRRRIVKQSRIQNR